MLYLVRYEHRREVRRVEDSCNVAHMNYAVYQVVIDFHMNHITAYRRIIEVCPVSRPIDTLLLPLWSFGLVWKHLVGELYAEIHKICL